MNKNKATATIVATGAAHPTAYHTTDEIIREIASSTSSHLIDQVKGLGVDGRYVSLELFPHYLMNKEKRVCHESTKTLAIEAAERCIQNSQIDPSKIGLLLTVTNTQDRPLPCLACEMMSAIDSLPKEINNLNLQNQGCSVLPKALDIANSHLLLHPDSYVLIVLSEAHSLLFSQFTMETLKAFQDCQSEQDLEKTIRFISALLFGDGAVGLLVGAEGKGLKMDHIHHATNIQKSHTEVIHMDQGGALIPEYNGLPFYYMSKMIPETGILYAKNLIESFEKDVKTPLDVDQYDQLFVHTGSKKILDGVLDIICDKEDRTKGTLSYEILRNYGNLSSASVPMMIHHFMEESPLTPKQKILALTFGVGFSGSILEFEAIE